jgi:hypothetical protein
VTGQERLYEHDPYALECAARVMEARDGLAVLDRTPILTATAGMEGDVAWIDGFETAHSVRLEDGATVGHQVPRSAGFRAGQRVHVQVEPMRRFALMKNAAAVDLVALGLLDRGMTLGVSEISAIGSSIELPEPVAVDVPGLAAEVNAEIGARLPIRLGRPRADGRRLCEVEGYGVVLGWGPRVAKTSEVGGVRLTAVPSQSRVARLECVLTRGLDAPAPHDFRRTRRARWRRGPVPPAQGAER